MAEQKADCELANMDYILLSALISTICQVENWNIFASVGFLLILVEFFGGSEVPFSILEMEYLLIYLINTINLSAVGNIANIKQHQMYNKNIAKSINCQHITNKRIAF